MVKWRYTGGFRTKAKAEKSAEGSRRRGWYARVVPARKKSIQLAKAYGKGFVVPRYEVKIRKKKGK